MKKRKLKQRIYAKQSWSLKLKRPMQLREIAILAREVVVQLRENKADGRDGTASARERAILAAEAGQAMSEDQIQLLKQTNAHLVIATMESLRLTEQVEMARVELDHLAHHDPLTDLPNRILMQDRLGQAIEAARRQGRQLAVIYMDLDRFKHINDSLGHAVGDQLLRSVAQRLVACVRHSDTVSRQGGDEFVLLLPLIEHAEDAALSAQKMLGALAQPHHIDDHDLYVSVSIGIGIFPNDGQDAEALVKSADAAMYYAKETGRNNYKFFESGMNLRAIQRQSIEASLRKALDQQEFALYYQPKVNLVSGAVVGVEALIRWQHPEQGLLQPSHFVAIAEDCGLILPIGRWVLREACLQAQAWQQMGLPPITMAVNTSATEFRDRDFLYNLRTTLDETHFDPHCLELELTEGVLMQEAESTHIVLHALADLGVQLAVDDFGTGYSSLSYLSRFPIDTLKIDQSFISHMSANPDDAAIVSAVISMGKSLNQRVIAEGVETPAQLAFLLAQHCDEGQGFYFSRPVTAQAFASLLQTGRLAAHLP
ncbi:MAG: EAL domain-containing protein [Rhodoferax sp.]|nr:EAL domain-containing protein [Rhodoferax sp.]MDP3651428.1 EAL domain-containing protein [Rhodoferax sp.]